MDAKKSAAWPATRAIAALIELDERGGTLCPPDADPYIWASEVLHDLARAAELLGNAAEHLSGERNPAVQHRAHALSTVLAAHGNNQLLHRHA